MSDAKYVQACHADIFHQCHSSDLYAPQIAASGSGGSGVNVIFSGNVDSYVMTGIEFVVQNCDKQILVRVINV